MNVTVDSKTTIVLRLTMTDEEALKVVQETKQALGRLAAGESDTRVTTLLIMSLTGALGAVLYPIPKENPND